MALKFPVGCDTPAERTECCYSALERLKEEHNLLGKWHNEGLTLAEYQTLPTKVKAAMAYKAKISLAEFRHYVEDLWERRNEEVITALLEQRALLCKSTTWLIDIGAI